MSDAPVAVGASVLLPHEVLHAFYTAGKTQALLSVFTCVGEACFAIGLMVSYDVISYDFLVVALCSFATFSLAI